MLTPGLHHEEQRPTSERLEAILREAQERELGPEEYRTLEGLLLRGTRRDPCLQGAAAEDAMGVLVAHYQGRPDMGARLLVEVLGDDEVTTTLNDDGYQGTVGDLLELAGLINSVKINSAKAQR